MQNLKSVKDFSGPASTGQTLRWESFAGKVDVAMVFLPDPTSTIPVLERLNDLHARFGDRRTQLIVIAPMTAAAVRQLSATLDLSFPILSDPVGDIFTDNDFVQDGDRQPGALLVKSDGSISRRWDVVDIDGMLGAIEGGDS